MSGGRTSAINSRPPGRRTRNISRTASPRCSVGMWWKARLDTITSNDPSPKGRSSAPAAWKVQLAGACPVAYDSIGSDGSIPITAPSGLTAPAMRREKYPVPHPMSSTRSPQ